MIAAQNKQQKYCGRCAVAAQIRPKETPTGANDALMSLPSGAALISLVPGSAAPMPQPHHFHPSLRSCQLSDSFDSADARVLLARN